VLADSPDRIRYVTENCGPNLEDRRTNNDADHDADCIEQAEPRFDRLILLFISTHPMLLLEEIWPGYRSNLHPPRCRLQTKTGGLRPLATGF
jgi:hypothetical protein